MIGVFDIGVGGLSVVKEISKLMPQYQIVYFGDIGRLPYSSRSAEERIRFSLEDANLLVEKGAQVLVIACNTISAVAGSEIQQSFGLPTFNVIDAGVKSALKATRNKKIGVIGSKALAESPAYPDRLKAIEPGVQTFVRNCQLFVYLVEENYLGYSENYGIANNLLSYFEQFNIDTLILGCTHFSILRDEIQEAVGKNVTLIDPATEVSRMFANYFQDKPEIRSRLIKGDNKYIISGGSVEIFKDIAYRFLGRRVDRVEIMRWS
jgi:glutamate racemase